MSWHIREAVRHIATGGVIAYPTETVYGLGCDPFNGGAVLRLLELKQRNISQGVILIASHFEQLESLLLPVSSVAKNRIMKSWPGPVTWTLPCLPETPSWLCGKHTSLAVRVTSHPVAAALCDEWGGPLVSSSANIHGKHPATSPLALRRAFNGYLDYILHDTDNSSGKPSVIRDGISGKIIRST
jgi:L-threonylcarbamoyladenylate synthase